MFRLYINVITKTIRDMVNMTKKEWDKSMREAEERAIEREKRVLESLREDFTQGFQYEVHEW